MSQLAEQIKKSSGLLDAVQAVTNRKAFLTLLVTFVACILLSAAFAGLGAAFGIGFMAGLTMLVGALLTAVAGLIGVSTAGFILNAAIRRRDEPTIGSALSFATATVHRQLGVMLLLLVFAILLLVAICVLLLICKIPGVGPVLYAVVFPLAALTAGVFFCAVGFAMGLVGPAIWEGNTIMRTIALLWAITRTRLISLIVQVILLALLIGLVGGIVFGVIGLGIGFTTLLSLPIIGGGMGGGGFDPMALAGPGGGHAIAASIGMSIVFACASVIPVLITLAGNCIIFANLTEDLSAEDAERSIKGALDAAKEKADQVKQKAEEVKRQLEESRRQAAREAAERDAAREAAAREAAAQQASAPEPAAPAAPASCPQCQASVTPDDAFCGNCGHRLN